jgi:AcrR family transcriptional regulator
MNPEITHKIGDRVSVLHNIPLGNLIGTVKAVHDRPSYKVYEVELDGGGTDQLYGFQLQPLPNVEETPECSWCGTPMRPAKNSEGGIYHYCRTSDQHGVSINGIPAAEIIEAGEKQIIDGLEARLSTERELRECAEKNLATLAAWIDGTGDGWPLSGHAYTIRKAIESEREKFHGESSALGMIAEERVRQIHRGFTAEHDDEHTSEALASAAVAYAWSNPDMWPFEPESWHPSEDPIRDRVKAGAFIVAEIERLQRLTKKYPDCKNPES